MTAAHFRHIDAVGGQLLLFPGEVRGGKAQMTAAPVPLHDDAREGERMSKKACGALHLSGFQGSPHAGGAQVPAVRRFQSVGAKDAPMRGPPGFQHANVAFAISPKPEGLAYMKFHRMQSPHQPIQEGFRRQLGESPGKGDDPGEVHPAGFENDQPLLKRHEPFGFPFRRHNHSGVGIEGDDGALQCMDLGGARGFRQQLPVPRVDTIKIPQGHDETPRRGRRIQGVMPHLHQGSFPWATGMAKLTTTLTTRMPRITSRLQTTGMENQCSLHILTPTKARMTASPVLR